LATNEKYNDRNSTGHMWTVTESAPLLTERSLVHKREGKPDGHSAGQISMEPTAHAYPAITPATPTLKYTFGFP